jgi:hypothetical protein
MPTDTMELIRTLDRDLRDAARQLGRQQARSLVDLYYAIQEYRKRGANQARAAEEDAEPNAVVSWVHESMQRLEDNIRRALGEFAESFRVGQWLNSLTGIGPVISAGLLTHIDVRKAPTVGHIWRFAGLDPTVTWGKGEKRPWNADLKRLCWITGDCFVKFSNHPKQFYGTIYNQRKLYETEKNALGEYADQAQHSLTVKRFGAETEARKHYEAGHLPPARIHMRALRHTVKLFLSHLHHVMHWDFYDAPPPVPYSFEHQTGHRHYVAPPNWDDEDHWSAYPGKSLRELLVD